MDNQNLKPISLSKIQANPILNSMFAPFLSPGAQLGQTQQSTATSAQEQQNLQAQNPGIQAQSASQQVQAVQNTAKLALGKSLDKGMDLKTALKTYTALGVKADDVFSQYLSQRPNELPTASPTELQNLGVSQQALGQIGQTGSFADRWNTRNAIQGIRDLQDKFHKTGQFSQVSNVLGLPTEGAKSAAAYNSAKNIFAEHLSSLIPGGSNASGDVAQLRGSIPDAGQYGAYVPGKADSQFQSTEDQLLKAKGYDYKDLGLSSSNQQEKNTGGKAIDSILQQATGSTTPPTGGSNPRQALIDVLQGNTPQAQRDLVGNDPKDFVKNIIGAERNVGVPGFNSALASTAAGGVISRGLLGPTVESATGNIERLPGALKSVLRTGAAMGQTGDVRSKMLSDATKANIKISGNDIVDNLKSWAQQKILGSSDPNDIKAVNDAVSIATKQYKNKMLAPNEIKNIYDKVSNAYTQGGSLRAPIQSELDNAKKQAFDAVLGDKVPGWNEATNKFSQLYATDKSTGKKVAGKIATTGAAYLLGLLGLKGAEHLIPEL